MLFFSAFIRIAFVVIGILCQIVIAQNFIRDSVVNSDGFDLNFGASAIAAGGGGGGDDDDANPSIPTDFGNNVNGGAFVPSIQDVSRITLQANNFIEAAGIYQIAAPQQLMRTSMNSGL